VAPQTVHEHIDALLDRLQQSARAHYQDRLVSLVAFGSMGRGTPRPDSDLDVLIVAEPLPVGRIARLDDFASVERALMPYLQEAAHAGFHTECSPVFKTPAEVRAGSPLFFDLVDDAKLLFDRDAFFADALAMLRLRLQALGARRIWRGNAWFWDLKPDYRPGDVFQL